MRIIVLFAALAFTFGAQAADKPAEHVLMKHEDFKWGKGPEALPPGPELAVLHGDPSKEGMFIVRLKFPANYKIPPHTHPYAELVTVISGELMLGMGKKLDEGKMTKLGSGGYAHLPQEHAHYAMSKTGTEIQISGMGPLAINYINPKDDPRKASGTTLK